MTFQFNSTGLRRVKKKSRVVCAVGKAENREFNDCGFNIFHIWFLVDDHHVTRRWCYRQTSKYTIGYTIAIQYRGWTFKIERVKKVFLSREILFHIYFFCKYVSFYHYKMIRRNHKTFRKKRLKRILYYVFFNELSYGNIFKEILSPNAIIISEHLYI